MFLIVTMQLLRGLWKKKINRIHFIIHYLYLYFVFCSLRLKFADIFFFCGMIFFRIFYCLILTKFAGILLFHKICRYFHTCWRNSIKKIRNFRKNATNFRNRNIPNEIKFKIEIRNQKSKSIRNSKSNSKSEI